MENKILNIGYIGFKVALYATYLGIALITLLVIYLFIYQGENLPCWLALTDASITASTGSSKTFSQINGIQIQQFLFNYTKMICIFIVVTFILKRLIQVIKSANKRDTFKILNIKNFQKIGYYFIALLLLDFIHLTFKTDDTIIKIAIESEYLLCAITSFILAEVFREGNKLAEENKLTI